MAKWRSPPPVIAFQISQGKGPRSPVFGGRRERGRLLRRAPPSSSAPGSRGRPPTSSELGSQRHLPRPGPAAVIHAQDHRRHPHPGATVIQAQQQPPYSSASTPPDPLDCDIHPSRLSNKFDRRNNTHCLTDGLFNQSPTCIEGWPERSPASQEWRCAAAALMGGRGCKADGGGGSAMLAVSKKTQWWWESLDDVLASAAAVEPAP